MIAPGSKVDHHHFPNGGKNHGYEECQTYFLDMGLNIFDQDDLFFQSINKGKGQTPCYGQPIGKFPVVFQVMITPILIIDSPALTDNPTGTRQ